MSQLFESQTERILLKFLFLCDVKAMNCSVFECLDVCSVPRIDGGYLFHFERVAMEYLQKVF